MIFFNTTCPVLTAAIRTWAIGAILDKHLCVCTSAVDLGLWVYKCNVKSEELKAEFQWITVLYGIECSFSGNNTRMC